MAANRLSIIFDMFQILEYKKPDTGGGYTPLVSGFVKDFRRRPTLPHGLPCSTIGAEELNFRVRDGNGCDLFAIATEKAVSTFVGYNLGIIFKNCRCAYARDQANCNTCFVAKPHDRLVPVS